MIDFLQRIVKENPDLDGTELIVDAEIVRDHNYDVPPGSILLGLRKDNLKENKRSYGTLVIMPTGVKRLM